MALSTAGLSYLGFRAYDAEEARAALRARATLAAAERALEERAAALLREADLAASSEDLEAPPHPLVRDAFVVSRTGRILVPETLRYPAAPRPEAREIEAVRGFLAEAERVLAATGAPVEAVPFVEEAVGGFEHPDLVAVLEDAAAQLYARAGNERRSEFLTRRILTALPQARDLDGAPLAPGAHLRLLRLLQKREDRVGLEAAAAEFAGRLADQAWGLPVYEREALFERVEEIIAPSPLPRSVHEKAALVIRLEAHLIPEALAFLSETEPGHFRHLVRPGDDGLEVMGWTRIEFEDLSYVRGHRLDWPVFVARIGEEARALVRLHGARIEIDSAPPIREGPEPAEPALIRNTDLGGVLATVSVRLSVPAPSGFGGLKALHLAMTALLAGALLTGTTLSLRAVRRELATARLRQNFIDNVSHELRTPLTSVRMYAEMLTEGVEEEKRGKYASWILNESERLSRLLEDVLDFSRLARGDEAPAPEPLCPAELVRDACARLAPQAEEEGFTVETHLPEDLPPVRADRDASVRALTNLLGNAIRYSGDAREVGVDARVEGDRVLLEVWDRGPGVPPEATEHLFTRFYRAPRDARRTKGVGLGLALAREIARAQGGDVYLVSTSEHGSRFALSLRLEEQLP